MTSTPANHADDALAAFTLQSSGRNASSSEIEIHTPVVRIGQGRQNDVSLDDDTVSSIHARLEYDAGSWCLTDLDSRNGTYVEGARLAPGIATPLLDGARVGFGAVEVRFSTRAEVDLARARAEYAPPAPTASLADRPGIRLPLWLVLLVALIIVLLVVLFLSLGGDPGQIDSTSLDGSVLETASNRIAA